MKYTNIFHRSFHLAVLGIALGALLMGCATTMTGALVEQIGVQRSVAEFIEHKDTEAERTVRASNIVGAVQVLSARLDDQTATVDELEAAARAIVAGLSPADRLTLDPLITFTAAALRDKVDRGVISGDAEVSLRRFFAWVLAAADAYVPHSP